MSTGKSGRELAQAIASLRAPGYGQAFNGWPLDLPNRLDPMRMLFFAHSGVRYAVLLVGLVALLYFAYAASTGKGNERVSRILGASFTGILDLQILLGIGIVVLGLFYTRLLGHLFMMIGAAVVAHAAMTMAKTAEPEQRRNWMRFAGVAAALVLIVGGIMAIGRSIFGSGAPTIGG